MTGKTAAGLVLIVAGAALFFYGVNYMNSFGARLGRELGLHDGTGFVFLGAGAGLALIGLVLAVSRRGGATPAGRQ